MYYRSRGWRKVLLRGERRWADAKYRGKYYEIKSATYNISSGEPLATSSTTSPPETTTDNSDNLGSAMSITNYRIPFSRLRRIVTCIRPIQKNQPNLDLYLVRRFKIWHFPIVVSYLCIRSDNLTWYKDQRWFRVISERTGNKLACGSNVEAHSLLWQTNFIFKQKATGARTKSLSLILIY